MHPVHLVVQIIGPRMGRRGDIETMKRAGWLAIGVALFCAEACSGAEFGRAHELGVSVGTPSAISVEYSREFGHRALYVSGGYWGKVYGLQVGVSILRSGRPGNYWSFNIVGGSSVIQESDADRETWTYAGAEALFRWRRFFAAPGLSVGSGTYPNPQLIARLGFTWRI